MASGFTAGNAIKPLQEELKRYCKQKGYTEDAIFEGLLDYIVGFLNPISGQPVEGWRFKEEDLSEFESLAGMVFTIANEQISSQGWYDVFGDLYMSLHSSGGGKEQYFTPPSVASAVVKINLEGLSEEDYSTQTPMGNRIVICDPSAGSGRLALAAYSEIIQKMETEWGYSPERIAAKRPYICCEDLDYNCVKMCAINICLHGAFGEALCHDTLTEPDAVRLGYIVNETMWPIPTPLPSIRKEMNPMRFATARIWTEKKRNHKEQHPAENEEKQLTLF